MSDLTQYIKESLLAHGADLVGVGDLYALPSDIRCALPIGICVAVKYPKEVIRGIADLPTKEYYDQYNQLNEKLDRLVTLGAAALKERGFAALPQTREYVEQFETDYESLLPHKTIATRAGIGWIGESALLVTKEFGTMVRISSILTDAPLETAKPVNNSKCGDCKACRDACPAGAISGRRWDVGLHRDKFFNAAACRRVARERAMEGFGIQITLCGKCIEVCPYTRKYLNERD
jgi:epoxyqueuosine reductase QueG